ncbi:hypothetical protein CRG98_030935 [Punica granatum]|uniref:DDE Tnp4 domain-containing protein n=1 Tax=Punica granatum TaxID=22663 RepID=A0A2I0IXL0_PUNGR|nr:hypothetical protein CRG98_030935 [Punica granatum]
MYRGYHGVSTLILEAIAGPELWIWHSFFGVGRSDNDIKVLDRSPVLNDVLEGRALEVNYAINGINYTSGYYLTDGMHPKWSMFVNSIPQPQGKKRWFLARYQERVRKDVKRAFGALQARFAIICGPAQSWFVKKFGMIMRACIVLNNMIVEVERDTYNVIFDQRSENDDPCSKNDNPPIGGLPQIQRQQQRYAPYEEYIRI